MKSSGIHHLATKASQQQANKDQGSKKPDSIPQIEQMGLYQKLKQRTALNSASKAGSAFVRSGPPSKEIQKISTSTIKHNQAVNQSIAKGSVLGVIPEATFTQGQSKPIPSLNLQSIDIKSKDGKKQTIQVVKKQIVYTRTDSVRSNATTYPRTNQGGSTKVVRLIREDESKIGDTSRTGAMQSVIKCTTGTQLVRKVQTPQVFKGKQKTTKRSSKLNDSNFFGSNLTHISHNTETNFNPFGQQKTQSGAPINPFDSKTNVISNQSPTASRLIYSDQKQFNPAANTINQESIQLEICKIEDDDELMLMPSSKPEEKMNFSFVESSGGVPNEDGNGSFSKGNNFNNGSFSQNEYYMAPPQTNQSVQTKEQEIMKKYGIVKITGGGKSSAYRNETNASRYTDRSGNTVKTNKSINSTSNRQNPPPKERGTVSKAIKVSIVKQHQPASAMGIIQSARTQKETYFNPMASTQKIEPAEVFNPFKPQAQKPQYGSVSPGKQKSMNAKHPSHLKTEYDGAESQQSQQKQEKFKSFQSKIKAFGGAYK